VLLDALFWDWFWQKGKGSLVAEPFLTKMHFDVLGGGQKKRNLKKSPHAFWQPHGF